MRHIQRREACVVSGGLIGLQVPSAHSRPATGRDPMGAARRGGNSPVGYFPAPW